MASSVCNENLVADQLIYMINCIYNKDLDVRIVGNDEYEQLLKTREWFATPNEMRAFYENQRQLSGSDPGIQRGKDHKPNAKRRRQVEQQVHVDECKLHRRDIEEANIELGKALQGELRENGTARENSK